MRILVLGLLITPCVWGQNYNSLVSGSQRQPNGTSDPATCNVGQIFVRTDTQALKICTSTNTWSTVSGGSGSLLSGTLASIPATCTVGANLYQATDQLITEQLYVCTATNTWTRIAYTQGLVASLPGTCTVGQMYFATNATAGQNLYFCTGTNTWTQQLNSGGSANSTNPLQTLANLVVRTSSTVLTLLPYAGASTPYNFGQTGAVYSFVTSPTATITGGSGSDTAYVYVDSGGTLTVGKSNLTVSCSGACTVVSGISSFPEGSIPIATWTASSATWDTSGGANKLEVAGTTRVVAGANCTVTGGNGTPYSITCAGGGGGSGVTCDSQTVGFATVAAGGSNPSVEVALTSFAGISGDTMYGQATFTEATQFSCGAATAVTVSMGRTGANNSEMTGLIPLAQTSGNFTPLTPPPPQVTSTYSLFLNFATTGVNVSACTAGSLVVRICHY